MILIRPNYEILTEINREKILRNIERAARTCYKSEDKQNETSHYKIVKFLLKRGHESVIEHENISVKFIVNRGVTHELVRHRLASYSQESTRYVSYGGGATFILPPWVNIEPGEYLTKSIEIESKADKCWFNHMFLSEEDYKFLLKQGWSPQKARDVLPTATKTEIIMTANLREWRHVAKLRISKAAHPQMYEVMRPLLREFFAKLPPIFHDIVKGED